jgi:hypothetical protein
LTLRAQIIVISMALVKTKLRYYAGALFLEFTWPKGPQDGKSSYRVGYAKIFKGFRGLKIDAGAPNHRDLNGFSED